MSGISSTLQCDPVEISFPSYAGAPLDIAGQIVCTEQLFIYARYFPVIFLALFMSASILVDFSRLYKVSHFEEATLRVHQSRVSFAWSESYLYCGWCAYGLSISLFFLSVLNWNNRPYGCWTKSWTYFFIFKIQIEADLWWVPEWKNSQDVWSDEGF